VNERHVNSLAQRLKTELRGRVQTNVPLARLTTYRLGGPAAVYVEPADVPDVASLGRVLRDESATEPVPVLALGRGSNVVVSDQGWDGVVVRLSPGAFSWIEESRERAGLIAGASTPLPLLANWAARRAMTGVEFLVAIPGSVGGAIRMNAGAHRREVADCLVSARIFDLDALDTADRSAAKLDLSYRHSNVTARHVVVEAEFALHPSDATSVRDRIETYRRHRAETQPGALQNAGSVFKNPPGDHAGRLIDAAGLKGLRVGGATVSELHANFFVAEDGARAQDVYELVHLVRARVAERFGVELEPEIRFAGPFRQRTHEAAR
jgi:UDP-N-acetylmuramate dehydrogenase